MKKVDVTGGKQAGTVKGVGMNRILTTAFAMLCVSIVGVAAEDLGLGKLLAPEAVRFPEN